MNPGAPQTPHSPATATELDRPAASARLPNFLVLGAAKAGTTSLYRYLAQHPEIFMSPQKEPSFFALEGDQPEFAGPGDASMNRLAVTRLEDYLELFSGAHGHAARGEASVLYLYAPGAARRIRRYVPHARLIVMLRNPVDRAYSAYLHLRRDGRETVDSFGRALDLEEQRIAAGWQHLWHYRRMGLYSEQVARYLEVFPRNQLLFIVFERFVAAPQVHLPRIFEFLQVDSGFVPDTRTTYARTGIPRRLWLHNALRRETILKRTLKNALPTGMVDRFRRMRRENLVRPPLDARLRSHLLERYRPDIFRLEEMIGEDLTLWLGGRGRRTGTPERSAQRDPF